MGNRSGNLMEDTKKGFNFVEWFRKMWTEHPLFSTACALLLMAVLQIIALGFDQASFGDWLSKYLRNISRSSFTP